MKGYVKRLSRLAAEYRAAEENVVRTFFARRPKQIQHMRWLKAQGYKEYSAIKPLTAALRALHSDIDRGTSRREFAELAEKLADETRHARLVMDLLQELGRKRITPRTLTWLPEDRRLARVRAKYSKSSARLLHGSGKIRSRELRRKDESLERAAITLTEGGGGALYRVCGALPSRGIEGKIAAAFRRILADEIGHQESGARALGRLIKDKKSFLRAAAIVTEVCGQRLRMRNEQFGFPIPPRDLDALAARIERSAGAR